MLKFKYIQALERLTKRYTKIFPNVKRNYDNSLFQRVNTKNLSYEHFGFWEETRKMIQNGDLIHVKEKK